MKINWKVRFKSKAFWLTMVPALLIVIQIILGMFGIVIDITFISNNLVNLINAIFVVLVLLGVVVDPTTKGVSDPEQVMDYKNPRDDQDESNIQMELAQNYEDDRRDEIDKIGV